MKRFSIMAILMALSTLLSDAKACTGITLHTTSSSTITARTIEWASEPLDAMYVVVPRGTKQQSFLPDGSRKGNRFIAKYGYVGIAVQSDAFIMEGINEVGLSAGLFYFPNYGEYQTYDETFKQESIADMQLVAWILSSFATIEQLSLALPNMRVISIDPRASTLHWRVTEPSGKQIVIEIINQQLHIQENPLGILTNSPELSWHLTNLNNYVNLSPGTLNYRKIGSLYLTAMGNGNRLMGIPGDMTPTSRFVRAAFLQSTAPRLETEEQTIIQSFHLLNNFDIPLGWQFSDTTLIPDMPSATQVTIAIDLKNKCLYYRTMYNSNIRCIDLKTINFNRINHRIEALDDLQQSPFQIIEIYE